MMYREDTREFIKSHFDKPGILFSYIRALFIGLKHHYIDVGRQWFWVFCRDKYPSIEEHYDVAIDFRGETGCYMMEDMVNADVKIGWFHGEYTNYPRVKEIDGDYWSRLDRLVVITEKERAVVYESFPELKGKVEVIHNLSLKDEMYRQAGDGIRKKVNSSFLLIQVGRLNKEKGYPFAIDACKILKNRGHNIEWRIVGDGPQREELERKIKENNLEDTLFLEGAKDNPYPYYKSADIYVHTAIMEGKPITMDEAKVFCLPIVTTSFSTVRDQIEDGVNGTITDYKPKHIADAIEDLILNKNKRDRYSSWLREHQQDFSEDIEKIEKILAL